VVVYCNTLLSAQLTPRRHWALATFGNPFGLALYDRERLGVRKGDKASPAVGPWVLRSTSGAEETSFGKPSEFAGALRKAMSDALSSCSLKRQTITSGADRADGPKDNQRTDVA
jgi:hypothetical protein